MFPGIHSRVAFPLASLSHCTVWADKPASYSFQGKWPQQVPSHTGCYLTAVGFVSENRQNCLFVSENRQNFSWPVKGKQPCVGWAREGLTPLRRPVGEDLRCTLPSLQHSKHSGSRSNQMSPRGEVNKEKAAQ